MRVPVVWLLVAAALLSACASSAAGDDASATTVAVPPDVIGTTPPATEPTIPDWSGDVVNPLDVHLGECINKYSWIENERRVQLTTQVSCEGPHDQEVYFETNFPAEFGSPYPGEEFLREYARSVCYREFEGFVGLPYELSELDLVFTIPPEDAFMDRNARYRGIVCYALNTSGEPLTGSASGVSR